MFMHQQISFSIAGLGFWRVPNRKLYAVRLRSAGASSNKRPLIKYDSDDDLPSTSHSSNETKIELVSEFTSLEEHVNSILELSASSQVLLGLKLALKETLKCKICLKTPIKPPVIIATCCKVIIGCEECINSWHSGDDALTKTCPSCRAERGYNSTMLLRWLDEFLLQIKNVMED
jgi:hypothetical protein